MSPSSNLFQPIRVGTVEAKHRVVHAPCTRFKADAAHVQYPFVADYYEQRSRTPGTILITEATYVAPQGAGYDHAPAIWNDEQIASWKRVTDAVHKNKSFIFLQIWSLGRTADPAVLKRNDPNFDLVSASDVPLSYKPDNVPRPLTASEIQEYVEAFATAGENAVRAGFDGIEIHGANGYLVDQFIQDVTNKRTDSYGGSIENRSRFALEIIEAISNEIGQERTSIRLSPWGKFQDMGMDDPIPQFSHLVGELASRFPNLAYIHVVEPRVQGFELVDPEGKSNDFIRKLWPGPLITAGGYDCAIAIKVADQNPNELIAFGRPFIANPDLPYRFLHDIPAIKGNRDTYYLPESAQGYTDYEFAPRKEDADNVTVPQVQPAKDVPAVHD